MMDEYSIRSYQSYSDYIIKLAQEGGWPTCEWLSSFFKEKGDLQDTFVAILDSANGILSKHIFVASQNLENGESLYSALQEPPDLVTTRLVLAFHDGYVTVDRATIDILGRVFELSPLFLMNHFFWDYIARRESNPKYGSNLARKPIKKAEQPVHLLSSQNFLSLDFEGAQFSAIIFKDHSPPTGKISNI